MYEFVKARYKTKYIDTLKARIPFNDIFPSPKFMISDAYVFYLLMVEPSASCMLGKHAPYSVRQSAWQIPLLFK